MDIRELPRMLFNHFVKNVLEEDDWVVGITKGGFILGWREQHEKTQLGLYPAYWKPPRTSHDPHVDPLLEIFAGARGTGVWVARKGTRQREDVWVRWPLNQHSLTDGVVPLVAAMLWKAAELAQSTAFEMSESGKENAIRCRKCN